jgi:inhibitor of cysteine peptidase
MDSRKWNRAGVGAIIVVLILAFAASVTTGCSSAKASSGPLKLTDADSGKDFTVKVGDQIQVILPGNMTTGYSWSAALSDKDAALLVQDGEPVYAPDATDGPVVGAGGTFTFDFKAVTAGRATLKLVYERSWESGAAAQTFEVQITIK